MACLLKHFNPREIARDFFKNSKFDGGKLKTSSVYGTDKRAKFKGDPTVRDQGGDSVVTVPRLHVWVGVAEGGRTTPSPHHVWG